VSGARVSLAAALLEETPVKVSAAIAFPFGAAGADAKRYEIEAALDDGAQEFEVVANHGWIKDGADSLFLRELRDAAEAADERPVKVVLEPGWLTADELVRAALLAVRAEAACLGLATGFGPRPATLEDIRRVAALAEGKALLKATVPRGDHLAMEQFLAAGAMRLGLLGPLPADASRWETA
jgi:deoxyribose-phosphate aldolase